MLASRCALNLRRRSFNVRPGSSTASLSPLFGTETCSPPALTARHYNCHQHAQQTKLWHVRRTPRSFMPGTKRTSTHLSATAEDMQQLTDGTLTIFYWTACKSFWGRAIGVVLTLNHAGKKMGTDYVIKEPKEAPADKGAAFPQVTLANGMTIAQTPAILDVLGESLGLNGETLEEKILCKQYILDLTDVFGEAQSGKMTEKPERAAKWFTLLESRLEARGTRFFLGDEPTVVDLYAVFVFAWVDQKQVPFDAYAKLTQWWKDVKEVQVVKDMVNSGIKLIPS